jgi:F-type H+-transporting ATPase subunit a
MQLILADAADPLEHVLPHTYWSTHLLGIDWNFTNQTIMIGVAALLMLMIFPALFSKPESGAPKGLKNLFEMILEFMRNEVFRPALKEHTDAFVPFLWTVFFFILFCNILGCIPLPEIFSLLSGGRIQHLGGAATGSINTTATLAIFAFFFIHFQGLSVLIRSMVNGTYGVHHHHENDKAPTVGMMAADKSKVYEYPEHEAHQHVPLGKAIVIAPFLYLWNFAPHPFKDKGLIADVATWAMLLVLELIGALIKPFALCMRLFGNMVSGHMVLAALIGLIISAPTILGQIGVGVPIMALDLLIQLLEVLVAFLQAYIFAFLTALFIGGAVAPEH